MIAAYSNLAAAEKRLAISLFGKPFCVHLGVLDGMGRSVTQGAARGMLSRTLRSDGKLVQNVMSSTAAATTFMAKIAYQFGCPFPSSPASTAWFDA